MKSLCQSFFLLLVVFLSCNNSNGDNVASENMSTKANEEPATLAGGNKTRHFRGAINNGMKGDSIFFDVSADGRRLENLTFKGYWRCSGRLEQITAGPEGGFTIVNSKVSDHISEPPDGGSTAWRFDLNAEIGDDKASGDFRMNINNLGCDTYKLKWAAVSQ